MKLIRNKTIALALLGLIFSCSNDASTSANHIENEPNHRVDVGSFALRIGNEQEELKSSEAVEANARECILKLEESTFGNLEGFSKEVLNQLLDGKEEDGWELYRKTGDFIFFSNLANTATGAIKVYNKEGTCYRIAVFQQSAQNFSVNIYSADAKAALSAKDVFGFVTVNDFLIPQHKDSKLEKYKSNINFLLTKEGELQADLKVDKGTYLEKIVDLNDVFINWNGDKFVKEIIEVE